ncbi:MAG: hypothetical protein GWP08_19965 [Nitrospiraceae bacterium]|nr:hypothetical protein [Nitrospiraceae bacterium]
METLRFKEDLPDDERCYAAGLGRARWLGPPPLAAGACPQCRRTDSVIPIIYGTLAPEQHDLMMAGLLVMGGQAMYEGDRDPTHFCTGCDTSFRLQ